MKVGAVLEGASRSMYEILISLCDFALMAYSSATLKALDRIFFLDIKLDLFQLSFS